MWGTTHRYALFFYTHACAHVHTRTRVTVAGVQTWLRQSHDFDAPSACVKYMEETRNKPLLLAPVALYASSWLTYCCVMHVLRYSDSPSAPHYLRCRLLYLILVTGTQGHYISPLMGSFLTKCLVILLKGDVYGEKSYSTVPELEDY